MPFFRKTGRILKASGIHSKLFCPFIHKSHKLLGRLSRMLGVEMSQTLIGLTIVAVGTSLPELVTSMVAAKKGESDLALGNVIGSNVFNVVFILGASAVVSTMTVDMLAIYDTIVLLFVSVLALIFARTNKRFSRSEGAVMIAIYVIYFVYALLR